MKTNLFVQFCFVLNFLTLVIYGAMTDKQLKAAGKLVRNMCQPKNKATDEDIDKMRSGDWNIDRTAMCYLNCVLNSQKLINKDNTINIEMAVSLANKNLPVSLRDSVLMSIDKCKDSVKTPEDKCLAAYEASKCVYEADPEHYFLP